ncbi:MAG TPA: HDOD domain-containing protein [Terriglobia bacterium]
MSDALEVMASPPPAVAAMNEVLGSSPIDLKRLSSISRSYPDPTMQILKLCNSSIFSLSRPISSLEQATVSLGAAPLRTLGLAWGLVERVGRYLPPVAAQPFWQHSLTAALLSERIAAWTGYPLTEAYLAGFLHDIGRVPLLMAFGRDIQRPEGGFGSNGETTEIETREFGADHCELGRRIGLAWQFSDLFIEVFGRHHEPAGETDEPELLCIVRAAESFCSGRVSAFGNTAALHLGGRGDRHRALSSCMPHLDIAEGASLAEILEFEFLQAAQWLKLGASKPFSQDLIG